VILDLENVAWIDTTGLQELADAKKDIWAFAGDDVVLRFVGVNRGIRTKFEMAG
jgi:anti-anti-sigma regulatory factor